MRLPRITDAEWKLISPLLPPTGGPGKPRVSDRRYCSAFFYAEARHCSLESLPGYANPRSLRTRRQRWEVDGTLAKVMEAGALVIQRMRREYWGQLRAASNVSSPDWKHWSEFFFGRGVTPQLPPAQPKGRYVHHRKRVPAG